MRYFKNVTWGMPVVMGRKTFESLGKPLPGRKNIILTRQNDWKVEDTIAVKSFEDALLLANEMDVKELMVIGGGEIFKMVFPKADRIHMTRVDAVLEGDAYFPVIDPKEWNLISRQDHSADEKHAYAYSFQVWERGGSR
jgi:dihydrofolate reductase